ncbi:hypothetical protein TELCIR_16853, partial [Teladorsagia circumcincta]
GQKAELNDKRCDTKGRPSIKIGNCRREDLDFFSLQAASLKCNYCIHSRKKRDQTDDVNQNPDCMNHLKFGSRIDMRRECASNETYCIATVTNLNGFFIMVERDCATFCKEGSIFAPLWRSHTGKLEPSQPEGWTCQDAKNMAMGSSTPNAQGAVAIRCVTSTTVESTTDKKFLQKLL